MASTTSKNKKPNKALAVAEVYFKINKLDSAIKQATQAKKLDPNLPNVDNYITAYKIHRAMSSKKNWYVVLGIPECSNSSIVKKRYKELALMVHPDKNPSAASEGAFKHIGAAWEVLSDPVTKKDYDKSFMSKNNGYAYAAEANKPATAAQRKAAAAAAAKEAVARKAAEEVAAAAARKAAEEAAAAAATKAAADAAALEAELAAAERKIAAKAAAEKRKAAAAAAAIKKAAEEAAASTKAAAAKEAAVAAAAKEAAVAAAAKEAAVAAAKSAYKRHSEPMSEIEYGIHLIMKYSPNYRGSKFSVL